MPNDFNINDVRAGNKEEGDIALEVSPLDKQVLMITDRALREIRYYQSEAMSEALLLPQRSFQLVVQEICDVLCPGKRLRWQRDALVALQMVSEDVIVMIMEMTYNFEILCMLIIGID